MTPNNILEKIEPSIRQIDKFLATNPYSRLMRLDKPIGVYLALLPALWAITLAGSGFFHILWLYIIFTIGAVAIRGAGCILNDIADRDFDKKVARTKSRPLASGEISLKDAYKLLLVLLLIGLVILLTLPWGVIVFGLLSIFPIAAYPYFKRFTYYPQIILGTVFNIGAIIGWFSANTTPSIVPFFLYFAALLWTIGYDTIYAHQDKKDDAKIGVKSMALLLGDSTPKVVWKLYLAAATLLAITGMCVYMNFMYFIFLALATYQLYWQTQTLNINNPKDCADKFKSNAFFGLIVLIGAILGKI